MQQRLAPPAIAGDADGQVCAQERAHEKRNDADDSGPGAKAIRRIGGVRVEFREADRGADETDQREQGPTERGARGDGAPADPHAAIETDIGMPLELR